MQDSEYLSPIQTLQRPFARFAQLESSQGILLIACTVIALVWANSPVAASYERLWNTRFSVGIGSFNLAKPMILWINDGLMAIFFLLVGLEIKREALVGELASIRKAALPLVAAVGGMVVPALIYFAFNRGEPTAAGWGIPMATDIAFALGVMAMLGKRVPTSLKVFLTALAIVDDIGAVLVIAIFYTHELHLLPLAIAAGLILVLILFNWAGGKNPGIYLLVGAGIWLGFLKGGIHATLAGVVLAMTIPARSSLDFSAFVGRSRALVKQAEEDLSQQDPAHHDTRETQHAVIHAVESACRGVQTPLARLEHSLHPWVSFFIMPLFALANAGVPLSAHLAGGLTQPVSLGIGLGLVLGKPVGVVAFSLLAIALGWAAAPGTACLRQLVGTGFLAGIGFTMSLFIAGLALDEAVLPLGKLAILLASLISGALGWILLRTAPVRKDAAHAA